MCENIYMGGIENMEVKRKVLVLGIDGLDPNLTLQICR